MFKRYPICINIAMILLSLLLICGTVIVQANRSVFGQLNSIAYNNNNIDQKPSGKNTFVAAGRIAGMIYTSVEKNFRGVQPPDVLLGAWHWKVEEGKIVDFNANISKISTIGEASQSVRIINFKTPVLVQFKDGFSVNGKATIKLDAKHSNSVLSNVGARIDIHDRQIKIISITFELKPENDIFRAKPVYGIVDSIR
jgi:hypothetical protein